MKGSVCSIFSVATALPSTFSTPVPPFADAAIVAEHHQGRRRELPLQTGGQRNAAGGDRAGARPLCGDPAQPRSAQFVEIASRCADISGSRGLCADGPRQIEQADCPSPGYVRTYRQGSPPRGNAEAAGPII